MLGTFSKIYNILSWTCVKTIYSEYKRINLKDKRQPKTSDGWHSCNMVIIVSDGIFINTHAKDAAEPSISKFLSSKMSNEAIDVKNLSLNILSCFIIT